MPDYDFNDRIQWQMYDWAENCFFAGSAFEMIPDLTPGECGPKCKSVLGCTHFQIDQGLITFLKFFKSL